MLETEGVENVLSGGGNVEDGIKSYNFMEYLPLELGHNLVLANSI